MISGGETSRRPVSRTRKALLVAASCASALLLMEAAVRVLDVPPRPLPPLAVADYRLSDDPVLRYEYVPAHARDEEHYGDAQAGFETNADGFRDRAHDVAKPPGVRRILVLGDSTTAGNGVKDVENVYPRRLEQMLATDAAGAERFEVFNMGVGGYQTLQEVEALRVKGLRYDPDVVVVTFCLNDFDAGADGGVQEALRKKNADSTWTPGGGPTAWLVRNSRLAFIVRHLLRASYSPADDGYERDVLKGRSPVRAGFELLSELRRERGFAAVVVILPALYDPLSRYKFAEVHRRVFEAAQGLDGVTVVDLLPRFAEAADDVRTLSYDGLHLNERGHEAMARILVPIVKDALASTPRPR